MTKQMSRAFHKYLTTELRKYYKDTPMEHRPRVVQGEVEWHITSDPDYPTDHEYCKFKMTDGKLFESYYWHKEFWSFTCLSDKK